MASKIKPNDLKRFRELFQGYTKSCGQYDLGQVVYEKGGTKAKGKAWTEKREPTPILYETHLNGSRIGLGLIPLMDDNKSVRFGCVDIDKYPFDHKALEDATKDIPVVITKSKSGGAHMWLFCREDVPATLVVDRLTEWAGYLGFAGCEIFPKQTARADNMIDIGNWINLPYFGDTRVAFIDGRERTLTEFLDFAYSRRMNRVTLESMAAPIADSDIFADGPPCLAALCKRGIPEGTRDVTLFNVALYLKKKFVENIEGHLHEYNKKFLPVPMTDGEVAKIAKSVMRNPGYHYQCRTEPLKGHCSRAKCKKRPFGIGESGADAMPVTLSGLTKVNTTPPVWYVNIDGTRVEVQDFSDLLMQSRFRKMAAEIAHRIIQPLKPTIWDELLQGLLDSLEVIEAPEDASQAGQFRAHLEDFFDKYMTEEKDQVLNHAAYYSDKAGRIYFRSAVLVAHIKKAMGDKWGEPRRVWAELLSMVKLDAKRCSESINGHPLWLWSVEAQPFLRDKVSQGPTINDPLKADLSAAEIPK